MKHKNKILLSIVGLIIVLIITISLSYAYFSANLTGGEEATTITVTGGTMNIIYNGGPNINIENIIPSNQAIAIKTFTVTGNNTTDIPMAYKLNIVIETNTFSKDALKYKLISTNTDNNGIIVPNVDELTSIDIVPKTNFLGIGRFSSPTNGNKTHTYKLEVYFLNTGENQNVDQGKELKAHIEILNAAEDEQLLNTAILNEGGGAMEIEAKGSPDFSKIAVSENTYNLLPETAPTPEGSKENAIIDYGIYSAEDEYGVSYYYRGERGLLNNNLIFGGFQWKIIRINGDGSVRIIYNGTEAEFNANKTMNTTGKSTQIAIESQYNVNFADAKYMGYMFGGITGVSSTSREEAVRNDTSSNAKIELDNWYQENILGKVFENKITDNLFCNNKQLRSEVGGPETGPGFGDNETHYSASYRLIENSNPTLKCSQQNDRFTVNDTIVGNGALTYPVGLITADEAIASGIVYRVANNTNYLYTENLYWTLTPRFNSISTTSLFIIYNLGDLYNNSVIYNGGFRPVINLSSDVTVTGEGTEANPYRVV